MLVIFDLLYREYCRARLAEMQKLLCSPAKAPSLQKKVMAPLIGLTTRKAPCSNAAGTLPIEAADRCARCYNGLIRSPILTNSTFQSALRD